MNEKKSCAVEWLGPYLDKDVQIMEKGYEEFTTYKLNNVYVDGTLELIEKTDDGAFVHFINVRDVSDIAIDICDTEHGCADIKIPK